MGRTRRPPTQQNKPCDDGMRHTDSHVTLHDTFGWAPFPGRLLFQARRPGSEQISPVPPAG